MKRTERRQLKENELATGLSRFVRWAQKHEKKFMAIALGLVILLALGVGVKLWRDYQKSREAGYLSQILSLKAELAQKPENLARLEDLSRKRSYGRIASLVLAGYYLEKNDLDQAEQVLSGVKDRGRDLVHYQILDLYAQVQARRSNYDRAIEIYRQIEKEKPEDYPLDVVLFRLAEAYEKKGSNDQALGLYRDLQSNYQNTYYGYQAALKLMKLETAR
ncbi:MAG: tetratricopeptide repeat protein [Candidatus Saccharicenans sp.]|jgi:predicted negative regulator of RcsB-dependent stress response|nr:tetratricopeptide repeat protein [Candidatus Saccharicenans sp.]MDH7493720.1 tetratricopeptide repeat protein [Candidatus Saccharicenans sp.]